jgi:glutaminyl-tRNA synthetase
VVKDADGNVEEVHCEYDPQSRGGNAPDGRRVQGTIHWVSAGHAEQVEVRLYDNLFTDPDPVGAASGSGDDFVDLINPDSLEVVTAVAEPALASVQPGDRYQFERLGYFCVDLDSEVGKPVFNRTTTLRDSWARISQRQG